MRPLKPALSYPQQIRRLQDVHNLTITDEETALRILQSVNYYRLCAYGIGLTQAGDREKFRDGITLEHLHRLYHFDSHFRTLLFHTIEQLEVQLRAQIAYRLACIYGPEGYMDPQHFRDRQTKEGITVHELVIRNFHKEIERQKNTPFVRHHIEEYGGHFPSWAAVELLTFGTLSSLYSAMLPEDQKEIAKLYRTDAKYLGSWLLALVEIRNICAHYGRIYNMPLKQTPFLYKEYRQYRSPNNNKVFPAVVTIKMMFGNEDRWRNCYTRLEALLDEYCDVLQLSYIGFPEEWKDILR